MIDDDDRWIEIDGQIDKQMDRDIYIYRQIDRYGCIDMQRRIC